MKKFLFFALVMTVLMGITAFADDAAIGDVNYSLTDNGELAVWFNVQYDTNAVAVASSYDVNGRLIGSKIVTVSEDGCSAEFDDVDNIECIKISVFDGITTLSPLCAMRTVNIAVVGDTDISVGPLFSTNGL